MNPTEMLEALSDLAEAEFNPQEFPYAFLEAFGNKETALKKLRKGDANKTDIANAPHITAALLQRNNIHLAVCEKGAADETLKLLADSSATTKHKVKFILVTDGIDVRAEYLPGDDLLDCAFTKLPDHFGFFGALAKIASVPEIKNSIVDIRATGLLNKLRVELLKTNPAWDKEECRHDINHFMAQLIFCFFAEDTKMFGGINIFTDTVRQMSTHDASNMHEIIGNIFRAMDIDARQNPEARRNASLPVYVKLFPYVNGGLFSADKSNNIAVPQFTRLARSYFLKSGELDWSKVTPDIFGSMIQAIADKGERAHLGMHYTSVPNILKVLNPLFLDSLRAKLGQAGNNKGELTKLHNRIKKIRVFDPACGSGNFLVIAYRELRKIEAMINLRRGDPDRKSEISESNFRGIELNDFPAEIARLALIIAKYKADEELYKNDAPEQQTEMFKDFLPLPKENWIICGNALRLDWDFVCPAIEKSSDLEPRADLLGDQPRQVRMSFRHEGGEVYICSNPPYVGSRGQEKDQKEDIKYIFMAKTDKYKGFDYVACWFMKAVEYAQAAEKAGAQVMSAFVSTNSICQGQQVAALWPLIFKAKRCISFAWESFKWSNLAAHKAAVIVNIIGLIKSYNTPPTENYL